MAQTPRLPSPEPGTRAAAALLAALLALGFLLLLDSLRPRPAGPGTSSAGGPRLLVTPRLIPPAPPRPRPTAVAAGSSATARPADRQAPPQPTADTDSPSEARASVMREARSSDAGDTTAAPDASGALKLDPATLRSAISSGKSAVQQLAERSGKPLAHTQRPSKDEQLAASIADAGVPGCLRPDAMKHDAPKIGPVVLGGILATPFWVHAALTGKCQ